MGGDLERRGRLRPLVRFGAPRVYRPGPFAAIYTALLVVGLVGAVGVYFLLLAVSGAGANRLDVAKTALLVIGGSGAVAGLYVAYRKQRTDEATHVRDQDKLFTERYTQAATQLGSDKAAVRLAGVYALARIADDSERDRPTCMEGLCAYLRMPYDPESKDVDTAEPEVRATAQSVLTKRLRKDHPGFWKDAQVDLRGTRLVDLDFSGVRVGVLQMYKARFVGDAGFVGAFFTGNASFVEATFTGDAVFSGNVRFGGAMFTGGAAFTGATFRKGARFIGVTFGTSGGLLRREVEVQSSSGADRVDQGLEVRWRGLGRPCPPPAL